MITTLLTFGLSLLATTGAGPLSAQMPWSMASTTDVKVPVTLGVMSRCPDALLCESVFNKVLPKVEGKIDLALTYVGRSNESEPTFGVTCKHGPTECAGNVQQLCVAKYRPLKTWWSFLQCQNYQGKDKVGNADVALKCARTSGIDWETSDVGQCAGLDGSGTGEEGIALLKESVEVTESLGIVNSCTVLINGEHVCVRDGEWRECENGHSPQDFVRQIEAAYRELNSGFTMI